MPADRPEGGAGPDPLLDETLESSAARKTKTAQDFAVTVADTARAGSFTADLATIVDSRPKVFIPPPFLNAGSRGQVLRLAPVEHLRGKEMVELYFKTAPTFSIGRSPVEADWLACFFPRNEKNDLRSMRLSKVHARLEMRDGQLWLHRAGRGVLHVGGREVAGNAGHALREGELLCLAEDYTLELFFESSRQSTLQFENGSQWRMGKIGFAPSWLGAVRLEPMNSGIGFRNSCWLFTDIGFGGARGGVFTAGYELAPQQGAMLRIDDCFWIMNQVGNGKVSVNQTALAANEAVPLTHGDTVWLGAVRYNVQIS